MKHEILLTAEQTELVASVRLAVSRVRDCQLRCVPPGEGVPWADGGEGPPLAWVIHVDRAGMFEEVLQALQSRRGEWANIPVLVIGDLWGPQLTREILTAGAMECFSRPLDVSRLALALDLATVEGRLRRRGEAGKGSWFGSGAGSAPMAEFVESGPQMSEILRRVGTVARVRTTVLIQGESGTGKTRLAKLIHDRSPYARGPFVAINCGALPAALVESELFGHRKGSFTGALADYDGKIAAADGGTLLLDEIDSLPLEVQAKLLRAVDEFVYEPVGSTTSRAVTARIIAATNADLSALIAQGKFRQDLLYRLNVVSFEMPPLRERREAIRPMAEQFLRNFAVRNGLAPLELTSAAWQHLLAYDWPGNARELRNSMEQLGSLVESSVVDEVDLRTMLPHLARAACGSVPQDVYATLPAEYLLETKFRRSDDDSLRLRDLRQHAESKIIQEALQRARNNRSQAARELGISRMALYKKLHQFGLI